MYSQVGKEIGLLVAQSGRGRRASWEGWRMAQGTSGRDEQAPAIVDGCRSDVAERAHRCRLIQELRETHERHNVSRISAPYIESRMIFRCAALGAVRVFLALVLEVFIGDAHLHVVGLPREDQE